jgi:hypothetical protein
MRFNIPLNVKFKPKNDAVEYSCGLTRNFSCEGLSFETQNKEFDFHPQNNLEILLSFPQSGKFVSLSGDIIWNKQIGHKSLVGVKLRELDKDNKMKILENISNHGNLSVDRIFNEKDPEGLKRIKGDSRSDLQWAKTHEHKFSTENKGILKHYLKTSPKCRVTFRLPKQAAPGADTVMVVGDFNEWNPSKTPMKKLKTGDFMLTLEFPRNREYRFRYLIDGSRWENDWNADRYDTNQYGSDDSILTI